jgi:hypothetical protein
MFESLDIGNPWTPILKPRVNPGFRDTDQTHTAKRCSHRKTTGMLTDDNVQILLILLHLDLKTSVIIT